MIGDKMGSRSQLTRPIEKSPAAGLLPPSDCNSGTGAEFMSMAKLTRSFSLSALAEGEPVFTAGAGRFSIGVTSRENQVGYHLHLTEDEAADFVAFIAQRGMVGA